MSPKKKKGHCDFCGTRLRGLQRRWCSDNCFKTYWRNHMWSEARKHAKRKVYVRGLGWQCAHCKYFFDYVEVNHIRPILGKHGQTGCWHHQEGLEVLCRSCHLEATRKQRAAGKFQRPRTVKKKISKSLA